MPDEKAILDALRKFGDSVTSKMTALTLGEPEDQLRGPFEVLMDEIGRALFLKIVCTGETRLPGRMGKPDYAVHAAGSLAGYVELKAPGVGAKTNHFTGHNKRQWKRFETTPNLIYSDGNEWALYRDGECVRLVRVSGDVGTDGKRAVNASDAQDLMGLLTDFLSWQPIIPTTREGAVDLKGLAGLLAPLCRRLREDVTDALKDVLSPLVELAKEWRQLLFPDASDGQFADAYAQTVTFALLLARSEGANPLTLHSAEAGLAAEHSLLSRALQVLTDTSAREEISASLDMLIRVIDAVPPAALSRPKEPWLYFYEDFLAAYDPQLRKDAGAYYTPVEVVGSQVRLVDDLLTNRLGKPLGFADRDVVTLDPAVGTGTYLLGVIDHALGRVEVEQGAGAVPGQAAALGDNLFGFEIMVGPFAVSELRVSRALQNRGAVLPRNGTQIYLTDTLESPHIEPPQHIMGWAQREFAEQHKRATQVKATVPVIVCIGNPPYDRHEAVDANEKNLSKYGGWVRFGGPLEESTVKGRSKKAKVPDLTAQEILSRREKRSILYEAFVEPALTAGHGKHVKNLYNLYVYFWRWALWKVFEHSTCAGPGVVSFISASSYLDGEAFSGMREHMRRQCDEIWILDLGGEGRGARKSENVFAIQTPVAIAIAARYGKADTKTAAKVRFAQIDGTRHEKLKALDAIVDFASLRWEDCPDDWQSPFRPHGAGQYFKWPLLIDLLPWQQSGVMPGRTWVVAPEVAMLERRWRILCKSVKDRRAELFKNSPTGRKIHDTPSQLPPLKGRLKAIDQLPGNAAPPKTIPYAYRSFDRQYIFSDARLLDRPGPPLWCAHSNTQTYLTGLLTKPTGRGAAITACTFLPDKDCFSARGAKDVLPFYRDAQGKEANILPGLLDVLDKTYAHPVTHEELFAYIYGVLAQPAFTDRYAEELGTRELRVPITKNATLFSRVRDVGAKLLWLHTYGQRYVPTRHHAGQVPKGKARCTKPVPGDTGNYPEKYEYNDTIKILHVGNGEFGPVPPEVYEFEISGLKVVQSWLRHRMKNGGGRKSSPLDDIRPDGWTGDFTTELLELLWVLEATIAEYPSQAGLLAAVVRGPCFRADELPPVPDWARKPPSRCASEELFDNGKDDAE